MNYEVSVVGLPSCSDEARVSLRADVERLAASSVVARRPVRTTRVNERWTQTTCHYLGYVDEHHRHQQAEHERTCHSRHVITMSFITHTNGPVTRYLSDYIQCVVDSNHRCLRSSSSSQLVIQHTLCLKNIPDPYSI